MTAQTQTKPESTPTFTPVRTNLLQRKCACGGAPGLTGECEECSKKKRFGLQTKLKINEPGDIYEQEADRTTDQVMATPEGLAVSGAPSRVQRFSEQSNGQMDAAPASVDEALASPGRPLEPTLRQDMEQRFGHDFSRVRVHADTRAAESAEALRARAYTVGQHVVLGERQPSPQTTAGRQLLAHELAHVVQQSRGGPLPTLVASSPLEQAADRAAAGIMQGEGTVRVAGASAPGIARQTPPPKPPVPQVRQTPFNFISESPALDNWKLSVKNMLEREYKQKFGTFEDAIKHFQEELKKLPSTEAREDYADRMRDRARKNFFRQESREPSYAYTKDQKDRLRAGAAPIEGQQLEHMEEVKTKVREGIKVPGHPERALDPANIYLTEGGKGGTAPKGTLHAEKWRTIKGAKDKSQEIRKNPPKRVPALQQPTRPLLKLKGSMFDTDPMAATSKLDAESQLAKGTPPPAKAIQARPAANVGAAVPEGGSLKVGRAAVDYNPSSSDPKSAIKVTNIDLSDYPPDKKGPVTGLLKHGPELQKLTFAANLGATGLSLAGWAAGGETEKVIEKVLEPIQSYFREVLWQARKEFQTEFPDTGSLLVNAGIDQRSKAYYAALAKVRFPESTPTSYPTLTSLPEKDRVVMARGLLIKKVLEQALGGPRARPEDMRSYQDAGSAYENAMIDLQEQLANKLQLPLQNIADDISQRASVLQGAGEDLEDAFRSVMQAGAWGSPLIYYQALGINRVSGVFKGFGANMGGFAAEINSRASEYQRLWDSLDKDILQVGTQLGNFGFGGASPLRMGRAK